MHGRTFKALKAGEGVTVWGAGKHRGRFGHVVATEGHGSLGRGRIKVRFADGTETEEGYRHVCCGDNSYEKYPEDG